MLTAWGPYGVFPHAQGPITLGKTLLAMLGAGENSSHVWAFRVPASVPTCHGFGTEKSCMLMALALIVQGQKKATSSNDKNEGF